MEDNPRSTRKWTIPEIRRLVQSKFNKRACWMQLKIAMALYAGKDVIGCAATGSGKTLSFWIPLLMALVDGLDKMSIVVTPLNLLGKQNAVESGAYQVVVMSPELVMGNPYVQSLWEKPKVVARILNFIIDESQCISQWSGFRKEYSQLGSLRYVVSNKIPIYAATATLPDSVLQDIIRVLQFRPEKTERILYSNDRPEIWLKVKTMEHPANSFKT
ncbi:P-loop containing nucleoside triphosphate hydrolase protein [Cyathus striatus]|nr:P-loop containing nucleoside triphosphate hydrolase protein [Cyathus striatus]